MAYSLSPAESVVLSFGVFPRNGAAMHDTLTPSATVYDRMGAIWARQNPEVLCEAIPHTDACPGASCAVVVPAFPVLQVTYQCTGLVALRPLELCPPGMWLGDGWEAVRVEVAAQITAAEIPVSWKGLPIDAPEDALDLWHDPWHRDPLRAQVATQDLVQRWAQFVWWRDIPEEGTQRWRYHATLVLAMAMAEACGATVDRQAVSCTWTDEYPRPREVEDWREQMAQAIRAIPPRRAHRQEGRPPWCPYRGRSAGGCRVSVRGG